MPARLRCNQRQRTMSFGDGIATAVPHHRLTGGSAAIQADDESRRICHCYRFSRLAARVGNLIGANLTLPAMSGFNSPVPSCHFRQSGQSSRCTPSATGERSPAVAQVARLPVHGAWDRSCRARIATGFASLSQTKYPHRNYIAVLPRAFVLSPGDTFRERDETTARTPWGTSRDGRIALAKGYCTG